ncbi:MAG: dihydropteroate synthase [Planctomycetaceae bacterium]|nr:dihydropteroate synthase [Planctomycetaceae bacterium]
MSSRENLHFVTGRLAEPALRRIVSDLSAQADFDFSIDVLPITVAALMTPKWIARHIQIPANATRIVLPGYCSGNLAALQEITSLPIDVGPRDLHELPAVFGQESQRHADYGKHSIEILAEINHAPRMSIAEIVDVAKQLAADGADLIDVGCEPGHCWSGVSDAVKALRDQGLRVSIDSFQIDEIKAAIKAGAELVLSVNATNRVAAADWGCEVVVIPDDIQTLSGLAETVDLLEKQHVSYRLDPILEPIGYGFAASLARYTEIRRSYPNAPMMMGIGNLTELTDVDSAGINLLLLGFCEELRIGSVLTTQVINWARSAVREIDLGRRLVHHAIHHQVLPKHLEPGLVMLRDPRLYSMDAVELETIAQQLKDPNFRLFAENGELHLMNTHVHLKDTDPYRLFRRLMETSPKNIDSSHAFYLGYEAAKAVTALTLGKQYRQDEALDWGFLTVPEKSHRNRKLDDS